LPQWWPIISIITQAHVKSLTEAETPGGAAGNHISHSTHTHTQHTHTHTHSTHTHSTHTTHTHTQHTHTHSTHTHSHSTHTHTHTQHTHTASLLILTIQGCSAAEEALNRRSVRCYRAPPRQKLVSSWHLKSTQTCMNNCVTLMRRCHTSRSCHWGSFVSQLHQSSVSCS